ncbi:DNA-binding protein [Streptomyces sp. RerS4]|uniref:DNA-binding protein n=1 Tax=Streptomyces sp. RerS4 TaxID=2942449 RepID=UPI00201C8948|nr:DNA-binding protein [Streptomyces sp. RerS4]UQW99721.1 DNA-binding protein [Streptomyces sp. RerS4]
MSTSTIDTDGTTDPVTTDPDTGGLDTAALLAAGAVLPADTPDADPSAVPLTARTYRHPALGDERVVVRLAAADLGAAEDLAVGFLGLVADGEPAVVGLGRRAALGFPEWVLVHHPDDGHQALALVPELDRIARQAKTKPKAALDTCNELAERLAASLPHFLPVFHEQVARIFLGVENTTYAAQLFGKARTSETRFGLDVDEERLDAVFLEFALAGALPVKVLTGYGKELSRRVSPAEAFDRFRRLCVRRTAGGLAPSAQATTELRRLARAAKLDAGEAEQDYLAELLPLPATPRAASGWWTAHRAPLVALARRVPSVRGVLLGMIPHGSGGAGTMTEFWLEVLEESGATAGLFEADAPAEERSPDGTAGWLERFHAARYSGWRRGGSALAHLRPLVARCADRLRAELALPGREKGLRLDLRDVSLLDLLLSLELPVTVTEDLTRGVMDLEPWRTDPERRDLAALCADERLRPAFFRTLRGGNGVYDPSRETVRLLAVSPGSTALVADWVREVAAEATAAGLPELPHAISRLAGLPDEALALAPKEVARAAALDLDAVLAQTLRGGMFEEVVWPAWEEAISHMSPRRSNHRLTVMDAWPYVIVANSAQVRVIGADSTVLTHDLRIPSGGHHRPGFHYTDDDLLVFWADYQGEVKGYWLSAPDDVLTLESSANYWSVRAGHVTLPLPTGGRTTGHGVLHRGDSRIPAERPVISDGTSYWTWERGAEGEPSGWAEYDPATGSVGRLSLPAFLADALRDRPRGSTLTEAFGENWLRPTPTVEGSVLGAPVDGLLGWRTVRVPDQGWHGSDPAGRSVTVGKGYDVPRLALTLPGDDRLRAVSSNRGTLSLHDPEGVVTGRLSVDRNAAGYSTEGAELPPLAYWYCLRARDPQGSAVLRAMDSVRAGALLKAAAAEEKAERVADAVAAALPELGEGALLRGVVDRVRTTLHQRKSLARVAAALRPKPVAAPKPRPERGPTDRVLDAGLSGLIGDRPYGYGSEADAAFQYVRALAAAVADTAAEAVPGRLHIDVPHTAYGNFPWTEVFLSRPAAVAYRAVVTGVTEEQRAALCRMLAEVDALGLASTEAASGRWRRLRLRVEEDVLRGVDGRERGHGGRHRTALPLGGGAVLGVTDFFEGPPGGRDFNALLHDPSGRFEVPAPYTGRVLPGRAGVPGDPERGAGWLGAFLKEAGERGTAPWFPGAAEEFTRLTGVSAAVARLVLAGLPHLYTYDRGFPAAELREALGLKATAAGHARDELRELPVEVCRELVAALLPAEPARLWTDGPDVAAAALVWNERVGRRTPVPEVLLADAAKEVRVPWPPHRALPALLGPDLSPTLSRDVDHPLDGTPAGHQAPAGSGRSFDTQTLTSAVALTAWLAHRLPAGDPLRACLPPALTAVRRRLAFPGLLLGVGHYVDVVGFGKAAGTPTERGEGYERFGAVVLNTRNGYATAAVLPALLDSTGSDPYLPLLRGTDQGPTGPETALRLAHDPAFAALLADPGVPAAGGTDKDGTWWPQDPSRSVPELVAEVSAAYGLGADAAALYLALLAMPDPTDRNTARWTGWKPARLKAARAELAASDLVVEATRPRAGRSLFLPGAWAEPQAPALPVETWKLPMYAMAPGGAPVLGALVPTLPAADLYRRAWERVREGDAPRFEELKVKRASTRRRG